MTDELKALFTRDLEKLKQEVLAYDSDEVLWRVHGGINNSAGNLALHLVGNLNHYIGAILGNSGYERNRKAEFSDKDVPVSEIIRNIDNTIVTISKTLDELTEERLQAEYPIKVLDETLKTSLFLHHLYGHLNYHLGQINYHRRLVR